MFAFNASGPSHAEVLPGQTDCSAGQAPRLSRNTIMTKHFLQVCDLAQDALLELLERAQSLENAFHAQAVPCLLKGKRVALSFEEGGFRNRVAFEWGIRLMSGDPRRRGFGRCHGFTQVPGLRGKGLSASRPERIADNGPGMTNPDGQIDRGRPHRLVLR